MKPRLKRMGGLWVCESTAAGSPASAFATTPVSAYRWFRLYFPAWLVVVLLGSVVAGCALPVRPPLNVYVWCSPACFLDDEAPDYARDSCRSCLQRIESDGLICGADNECPKEWR